MARINKWRYRQDNNRITINDNYDIDFRTGCMWNTDGTNRIFPAWIFNVRDAMQIIQQIHSDRQKKAMDTLDWLLHHNKNYTNEQLSKLDDLYNFLTDRPMGE